MKISNGQENWFRSFGLQNFRNIGFYIANYESSCLNKIYIPSISAFLDILEYVNGKPLFLDQLRDYYKEFSNLSLNQRMSVYRLREDRADVIVPALLIYINVMRWAESEEIFVPKIGLADGLIKLLYTEIMLQKN